MTTLKEGLQLFPETFPIWSPGKEKAASLATFEPKTWWTV